MIRSISAEIIKVRRSGLIWLATLGTLIVNSIFAILALYYPDIFIDSSQYPNVWYSWITFHYQGILGLLLPMYLVIICALSINLENRNETWRLLYVQPVPKYLLYLAKLFTVTWIFIMSHLFFLLLLAAAPAILQVFWDKPTFHYKDLPIGLLISYFIRTILSSFGIIGLVFFISFFSRSFIFPLACGILGFVLASVLLDASGYPAWFPFAYPALNLSLKDQLFMDEKLWMINLYSVLYYLFFLAGGIYFSERDTLRTR